MLYYRFYSIQSLGSTENLLGRSQTISPVKTSWGAYHRAACMELPISRRVWPGLQNAAAKLWWAHRLWRCVECTLKILYRIEVTKKLRLPCSFKNCANAHNPRCTAPMPRRPAPRQLLPSACSLPHAMEHFQLTFDNVPVWSDQSLGFNLKS